LKKFSKNIAIPINANCNEDVLKKVKKASKYADLMEIWGDKLNNPLDFSWTKEIRKYKKKIIFCLKDKKEKGDFKGNEKEKIEILSKACFFCDFVDLAFFNNKEDIEKIIKNRGNAKIILSFHDFDNYPKDIKNKMEKMLEFKPQVIKISIKTNCFDDCLNLLKLANYAQKKYKKTKFIFIAMGEQGKITRIFSPIITKTWGYAGIDKKSINAPGQMTAKNLIEIWKNELL